MKKAGPRQAWLITSAEHDRWKSVDQLRVNFAA